MDLVITVRDVMAVPTGDAIIFGAVLRQLHTMPIPAQLPHPTTSADIPQRVESCAASAKLAHAFKNDNRPFRYDKFFSACGLDPQGGLMPNSVVANTIGAR